MDATLETHLAAAMLNGWAAAPGCVIEARLARCRPCPHFDQVGDCRWLADRPQWFAALIEDRRHPPRRLCPKWK